MKNQKGEIATGLAIIVFMWGVMAAVIAPSAYYDANKDETCPEYVRDTTHEQRQVCYLLKDATELDYTIVEKG